MNLKDTVINKKISRTEDLSDRAIIYEFKEKIITIEGKVLNRSYKIIERACIQYERKKKNNT